MGNRRLLDAVCDSNREVRRFILAKHEGGVSYDAIARAVEKKYHLVVSGETVRRWIILQLPEVVEVAE